MLGEHQLHNGSDRRADAGVGSSALASDIRIAPDTAGENAAFIRVDHGGSDVGASYFLPV